MPEKTIYGVELDAEARSYLENLPTHLCAGIERYIEECIRPGHFLCYVFEGDLFCAVGCADPISASYLYMITSWIQKFAPSSSFGSRTAVDAWIARSKEKGTRR